MDRGHWTPPPRTPDRKRMGLSGMMQVAGRLGVWFSVFLGLLVVAAWPFLGRDPTAQVLDVLSALLVLLLLLCSTCGVRLAVHLVERAIIRHDERSSQ